MMLSWSNGTSRSDLEARDCTSSTNRFRHRSIVVNADDFGATPETNRAVVEAFERGIISSATVMVNMRGFDDACRLIRRHHLENKVGLHLNFTTGAPLTRDIASRRRFCDGNGNWLPPRKLFFISREEASALASEVRAQAAACRINGFTPTHWDSHHHMHAEPGVAAVIIRVARELGVDGIRIALNCGADREDASWVHCSAAQSIRDLYNRILRLYGLARTRYFGFARDMAFAVRSTKENLELMVHPALSADGRLIDDDGEDLEARIAGLDIPANEMSSYAEIMSALA